MGSMNSPNSWAPYYTYRDCSQGICSIYCPQWCYLVYPPPPPPFSITNNDDDDDYPFNFSPLIIAVIGILSSAILLIAYYVVLSKYCRRRATTRDANHVLSFETNQVTHHDHYQACLVGLDEFTIKSIAVFKYKVGQGSVDGTECSVCLSEFQENDDLRLLPKCNHSFHVVCIDTWLRSHSNCPLCRANVVVSNYPVTNAENSPDVSLPAVQVHRDDDVDLVAENGHQREDHGVNVENREVERPSSLSVADILQIRDDGDDIEMGIRRFCSGIGSSERDNLMKNG